MTASRVEHLLKGRLGREPVSPLTESSPDLTIEQAYVGVFGGGDAVPITRFATQTAAEVMGNPFVSLVWAANCLGRQGRGLRRGDVVLTGSISKVLRPSAGRSVRASFTRLGSVSCRFV